MLFKHYFTEAVSFYQHNKPIMSIILAVLIVLAAFLARQILVNVILKMLKRLTNKTKNDFDNKLIDVVDKPARFALLIIGISLAFRVLPLSPEIDVFVFKMAKALITFSLFWAAYRAAETAAFFIRHLFEKTGPVMDKMLIDFVRNSFKVVIVSIGFVTILQIWDIDVAGILTGLGLGGLAFALAAKDTAANLFGSITIMADKPFKPGDWIKTSQAEGVVEEIGFRSTKIRTFEQAVTIIPNSIMSNEPIVNWSRMGKRRISFRLGVSYSTTDNQMRECVKRLRSLLTNHPDIHKETIFVYFERFGESSLDIFMYFFTKTTVWEKFLEVQEDVNLKIVGVLKDLGISIALPARSIYLNNGENINNVSCDDMMKKPHVGDK
jgi:MscS family membrane protein